MLGRLREGGSGRKDSKSLAFQTGQPGFFVFSLCAGMINSLKGLNNFFFLIVFSALTGGSYALLIYPVRK
jgi:hypothetical protein